LCWHAADELYNPADDCLVHKKLAIP